MNVPTEHHPSIVRSSRSGARAPFAKSLLIFLMAGFGFAPWHQWAWGGKPEIIARVNGEPANLTELQRMLDDPPAR